jgi:glycosyltransferase involved in cell wall biosynthesis
VDELADALAARFPRVAISHEWLTIPGGSENVVLAILELLPHAELFTTVYDPAPWPAAIRARPVRASPLDRLPGAHRHYPKLLPLMDAAFRRFDLRGFDLVVSSNHANAKSVRAPAGVPHVCYCHTPMRYAWDPGFLDGERLGGAERLAFRALAPALRRTDRRRAAGVTRFAANSNAVAARIHAAYGRPADVVHPPVEVDRFAGVPRAAADDAPYLVFGRIVPYKKVDVAVQACLELGRPLRVAGDGRDLERVRALAAGRPEIELLGRVDDADVPELLATSRALLFPGLEDFGIVPVEAQAAGLPVIAYGVGGARDSVRDGETGVLYDDPSPAGLAAAIERFERLRFDEARLRAHAAAFAPTRFRAAFGRLLLETTADERAGRAVPPVTVRHR